MSAIYNNPFPNVPSASKLHRVLACPASHKAELAAGDVPEDTRDADEGQDVHAVLSDDLSADDVSYSAAQTAEMCENQVEQLLREWPECFEEPCGYSEQRLGLTDIGAVIPVHEGTKANVIFSGQYDRLFTCGPHGLLIDFKALHGKHASALENPQLMGLAVLVAKRHKLTSLRVALVQPWKGKPTVADYSPAGLAMAESALRIALEKERNATPEDRKAGDWCKFCKARFGCDKFQSANINALDIVQPETLPADPDTRNKAVFARMAELSPAQLIHLQKHVVGLMGVFIASHKAIFKQRVEAGEIPGYTIKTSQGNREITDAQKAFNALEPLGVTAEDILACCSLPISPLQEAVRKRSGIKSQTEKRTLYNLTADDAKKKLDALLTEAGALARKADKTEVVEIATLD